MPACISVVATAEQFQPYCNFIIIELIINFLNEILILMNCTRSDTASKSITSDLSDQNAILKVTKSTTAN